MEEIKRIPVTIVLKEYLITFKYRTLLHRKRIDKRSVKHFSLELAIVEFLKATPKVKNLRRGNNRN